MRFIIPAVPVAQPRQRFAKRGNFVSAYIPKSDPIHDFKATVRMVVSELYKDAPLDCPLAVVLEFVFPRPSTMRWKRRAMPRAWRPHKPDGDNLVKAVWDSLNGLLWQDDALIVDVRARKFIASGDEQPHVVIEVHKLQTEGATN